MFIMVILPFSQQDGYFAYSYRLRPGVNWDSHGLKVAQLAGLPDTAIQVASDALSCLNKGHYSRTQQRQVIHYEQKLQASRDASRDAPQPL